MDQDAAASARLGVVGPFVAAVPSHVGSIVIGAPLLVARVRTERYEVDKVTPGVFDVEVVHDPPSRGAAHPLDPHHDLTMKGRGSQALVHHQGEEYPGSDPDLPAVPNTGAGQRATQAVRGEHGSSSSMAAHQVTKRSSHVRVCRCLSTRESQFTNVGACIPPLRCINRSSERIEGEKEPTGGCTRPGVEEEEV
jgi:hypothetical protein